MGPGPSNVDPRVLLAMARPTVGHLDPSFLGLMDELAAQLRQLFGTANRMTIPISGTGSAGMETAFDNLLEPGETAIIGVNGVFGQRMVANVERAGARAVTVEAPWGEPLDVGRLIEVHGSNPDARLLAVVHAETSTGVLQPLEELGAYLRETETLFVVDTVTSLGGVPVEVDERGRKEKVHSWYLDLTLIGSYWGGERAYHHTAPINALYGLHEGLRIVLEEGLAERFERHRRFGAALQKGMLQRGLELLVDERYRLPQLTSVRVPGGVDEATYRRQLLERFGIEVGGGLGPLAGAIWRVGLMGETCREANVTLFLSALDELLGGRA
jgi:alanine-glyoxylate transaminase/serine-glyoxylate transaminase/serine-pyruvate transaminase